MGRHFGCGRRWEDDDVGGLISLVWSTVYGVHVDSGIYDQGVRKWRLV
jgi:hypothetical protein